MEWKPGLSSAAGRCSGWPSRDGAWAAARACVLYVARALSNAYRRSPDKIVPWRKSPGRPLAWLLPVGRLWRKRPVYSATSFLFHVGLLLVPLFLAAHVSAMEARDSALRWPALPQAVANWLTLLAIAGGLGLFCRPPVSSAPRGR